MRLLTGRTRTTAWVLLIQIVSRAVALGITVLATHELGGRGYGAYAYALAWANTLTIPAALGFDRYLIRAVGMYADDQRWGLLRGLLRRSDQAVAVAGVLLGGVLGLLGVFVIPGEYLDSLVPALAIPLVGALIVVRQAALQALGKVARSLVPYYLVGPVITMVLFAGLIVIDRPAVDAPLLMLFNVLGMVVALAFLAAWRRPALPQQVVSARPQFADREWRRRTLPLVAVNGILLASTQIGTIILGFLGSSSQVGTFNICMLIAQGVYLIVYAVNVPFSPAASRLHARGLVHQLQAATTHAARLSTALTLPVLLILVLEHRLFLGIFGHEFAGAGLTLGLIAVAQFVSAGAGPAEVLLIMSGSERLAAIGYGTGIVCNCALTAALVPSFGAVGAAAGFLGSTIVWNAVLLGLTCHQLGVWAAVLPGPASTRVLQAANLGAASPSSSDVVPTPRQKGVR